MRRLGGLIGGVIPPPQFWLTLAHSLYHFLFVQSCVLTANSSMTVFTYYKLNVFFKVSHQDEMLAALQTTDPFLYVLYWRVTSHYMFMTRLRDPEVEATVVELTDEKAAKPVTAAQDRVSTFQQVGTEDNLQYLQYFNPKRDLFLCICWRFRCKTRRWWWFCCRSAAHVLLMSRVTCFPLWSQIIVTGSSNYSI